MSRVNTSLAILVAEAYLEDPNRMVSLHPLPILRMSNVYCGARDAETGEVSCRFTVVHRSGRTHRVAILTRGAQGWEIQDEMGVWEPRRR